MLTRTMMISVVLMLLSVPCVARAQVIPGARADSGMALAKGEWLAYGGTYAAARYSPLAQLDRTNAKGLHIAWRWRSPDEVVHGAHPLAYWRNGDDERVVILTAFAQLIALDAKTGRPVPTFGINGRVDLVSPKSNCESPVTEN